MEQGTGNREQEARNGEQEAGSRKQGARIRGKKLLRAKLNS